MSNAMHLSRRFFRSLKPGGPSDADRSWVETTLSEDEYGLWCHMSGPDRRHSTQVARDVDRILGNEASLPVLAAALLHDIGKIEAGTFEHVSAYLRVVQVKAHPASEAAGLDPEFGGVAAGDL